jgi:uncharacterized membrane protein
MAEQAKNQRKNQSRAQKKKAEQAIQSSLEFDKTWTDRIAQFITDNFGSIKFLCLCLILFMVWILWNMNLLPIVKPFDPYPFVTLNMSVSLFSIILSVSVLISQNMEGRREKIRGHVEFEVNVRAENEITKMLTMLHEIQKKMGINNNDSELEIMKENIDLQQLHQQLDESEKINP